MPHSFVCIMVEVFLHIAFHPSDHIFIFRPITGFPELPCQHHEKLAEVTDVCRTFLNIDPLKEYIPVYPGIHYFMGGVYVDSGHRSTLPGLYAAGECACLYHGANRLGGNSTLGAIYGGQTAVQTAGADQLTCWSLLLMSDGFRLKPAGK